MLVGQPQRADAPQRREWMSGRQRNDQRLLEQRFARELGVGYRRADETDVNVVSSQRGRLLRQREFAQFEPHTGMGGGELAQHRRQQRVDAGRHEPDRQPSDTTAIRGARKLHRGARAREDVLCLFEEARAGVSQSDLPARAGEETDAEFLLQAADGERQRRLRDRQPARGPAEVQFLGQRDEVAQRAEFHRD